MSIVQLIFLKCFVSLFVMGLQEKNIQLTVCMMNDCIHEQNLLWKISDLQLKVKSFTSSCQH
jgi:hypothetical protein